MTTKTYIDDDKYILGDFYVASKGYYRPLRYSEGGAGLWVVADKDDYDAVFGIPVRDHRDDGHAWDVIDANSAAEALEKAKIQYSELMGDDADCAVIASYDDAVNQAVKEGW